MPPRRPCCAVGSHSVQSRESTASFFKFPKEPAKCDAWEINVRRKDWCACDAPVLCSAHFTADSYNDDQRLLGEFGIPVKKPRLRPNAVPTAFTHHSVLQAKYRGAFEKRQRKEVSAFIVSNDVGRISSWTVVPSRSPASA
ncbi:hypothetical protein HPB51_005915 [Rhipicephalus microplus]|uniref:THAP-type domain-containing protein n=1 Tax=Rhipicephalus microplus TaxID=6941 RepID=A0A9J6D458_RHIMP|nr:hypothetical protein HPB51_005915 [Rhipicephalus microplus]